MSIKVKKHLKKMLVIGLSIVCLNALPIYATDARPVLTLEESIKSGTIYSNQIALNAQERDLLKERLKANQNNIYEVYQSIYLQKAKNENQAKVLKDQMTYDITNRYNAIVILEKELMHLEREIALKTKELMQMQARKEAGVITPVQYDSAAIELEDLKNSRQSKLEFLANEQSYFKLVTGKDLTKYILDDAFNYEIFRIPGSVDRYMDSKITEYLKYDQNLAQFAKDHIIIAGTPVVFYADYLDKKYTADKNLASLEDARKAMKDALMNSYSNLISLEEQISTLETKHQLVQKQAAIAKAHYEAGMSTALDYNKQILSLEAIELNIRKLITNYNVLKEVIQKPWMAME
ncbi:TolC family protein [Cellulosilyticum sp. I15G10I2]|uniref:TolC family protein n=1 Tax=Cellulosilyticum sp. I15G10I2 TaxID=1892843 RepID=UPI00085C34C2|nr:TolC family protein [Cellulosilyticum sp. I15G10I2]